nr:exosome complex component CSL4-like [Ciona intestinalis]|eukprot:XP_002122042.1 exosome complex component CSL4-like [Ciona intestinalis]
MEENSICIPGERLGSSEQYQPGKGTYVRHGFVFASIAGSIKKESDKSGNLPLIHVQSIHTKQHIPQIGGIVICKMTQLTSAFAKCKIISVQGSNHTAAFRGIIRKEDVRATNRDKVEIYKSFRPGDIVVARVLSLGDALCYLLSTAENELGVVVALSENGTAMIPLAHDQMQCPITLLKQFRKVARPQSKHISFPENSKSALTNESTVS